jgi:flagellar basal-body rod modification protein FlgD
MSTTPVTSSVNGQQYVNGTPVARETKKTLDMAAFLQILTTQMVNQNPLSPMDDAQYFGQIAQMGTVQGIDEMKKSAATTLANSYIGKTVQAMRNSTDTAASSNPIASGTVDYVVQKSGKTYIGIKESNGGVAEVDPANVFKIAA